MKVLLSEIKMHTHEQELAYRTHLGKRRHPKLFTIGEKSRDIVDKLLYATAFSDVRGIKRLSKQLLNAQKFEFLYHGDILIPVFDDERKYKIAMVVDMSSKSIVDHQSIASSITEESDRPVYIGTSVIKHINTVFKKSAIEFYKILIESLRYDIWLEFEINKDDPWIKQLKLNVKEAVYIPTNSDLYLTLETGKEIHISVHGDILSNTISIKDDIIRHISPNSFDQIQDVPVTLFSSVEKGKFIYIGDRDYNLHKYNLSNRKTAKLIYMDNDDVVLGLRTYMKYNIVLHGDIVIPLVNGHHFVPNAMIVDLKKKILKHASKENAIFVGGDTVTRHITRHLGMGVFDYYIDVIKNPYKIELIFKLSDSDPFIKEMDPDHTIKSLIYELPSKTLTLDFYKNERVVISPFVNDAQGKQSIQSILRKHRIDIERGIQEPFKQSPQKDTDSSCSIM
jgi:hypothetical protein